MAYASRYKIPWHGPLINILSIARMPLFDTALQCKRLRSMLESTTGADVCVNTSRCRGIYDITFQQVMSLVLQRTVDSRHVYC